MKIIRTSKEAFMMGIKYIIFDNAITLLQWFENFKKFKMQTTKNI